MSLCLTCILMLCVYLCKFVCDVYTAVCIFVCDVYTDVVCIFV